MTPAGPTPQLNAAPWAILLGMARPSLDGLRVAGVPEIPQFIAPITPVPPALPSHSATRGRPAPVSLDALAAKPKTTTPPLEPTSSPTPVREAQSPPDAEEPQTDPAAALPVVYWPIPISWQVAAAKAPATSVAAPIVGARTAPGAEPRTNVPESHHEAPALLPSPTLVAIPRTFAVDDMQRAERAVSVRTGPAQVPTGRSAASEPPGDAEDVTLPAVSPAAQSSSTAATIPAVSTRPAPSPVLKEPASRPSPTGPAAIPRDQSPPVGIAPATTADGAEDRVTPSQEQREPPVPPDLRPVGESAHPRPRPAGEARPPETPGRAKPAPSEQRVAMPTHQPAIPEAPQAEVTLPATHGETASSINQGVPAPVVNGAPAIPEQPVPTLHRAAPHAPNGNPTVDPGTPGSASPDSVPVSAQTTQDLPAQRHQFGPVDVFPQAPLPLPGIHPQPSALTRPERPAASGDGNLAVPAFADLPAKCSSGLVGGNVEAGVDQQPARPDNRPAVTRTPTPKSVQGSAAVHDHAPVPPPEAHPLLAPVTLSRRPAPARPDTVGPRPSHRLPQSPAAPRPALVETSVHTEPQATQARQAAASYRRTAGEATVTAKTIAVELAPAPEVGALVAESADARTAARSAPEMAPRTRRSDDAPADTAVPAPIAAVPREPEAPLPPTPAQAARPVPEVALSSQPAAGTMLSVSPEQDASEAILEEASPGAQPRENIAPTFPLAQFRATKSDEPLQPVFVPQALDELSPLPARIPEQLMEALDRVAQSFELELPGESGSTLRVAVELRDGAARVDIACATLSDAEALRGIEPEIRQRLAARGLDLAQFTAQRDPQGSRHNHEPEYVAPRRDWATTETHQSVSRPVFHPRSYSLKTLFGTPASAPILNLLA